MKRNLLGILSMLFLGITANAQTIVYSNEFSADPKSLMTPGGGLRDSTDGSALLIYAPNGHDEWAQIDLTFPSPLDFSVSGNKPVVSMIVSCDQTVALEVLLVDDQGKISDNPLNITGQPLFFNVIKDEGAKAFSYDFKGQFTDNYGDAGQPKGDGKVDSTKIVALRFKVNPGYSSSAYTYHAGLSDAATYKLALSGTILIDKLQIGAALSTGVAKINSNDKFALYPNPTTGLVNVSLNNPSSDMISVSVANVLGQEIYSTQTTQSSLSINLSGNAKGIYYISTQSKQGITTKRLFLN